MKTIASVCLLALAALCAPSLMAQGYSPASIWYNAADGTFHARVNGEDQVVCVPGSATCSGSPTGAAGGALSGTYPNPGLASTVGVTGQGAQAIAAGLFVLSNSCPQANTGNCFYSPANTQVDNTASWTTSNGVVVITDGKFTAADVGKTAWGYSGTQFAKSIGCDPYISQPQSSYITLTHMTISTFTDSNHVTLSGTPAVASANATSCLIWGTPDDSGASALETAYDASASCPKIDMQSGNYMFTAPHFNSQPAACYNLPEILNPSESGTTNNFGNIFYSVGVELAGRGVGPTHWFLPPDFPETGSCNSGLGGNACFHVPGEGYYHDFAITSGSLRAGLPANKSMIEVDVGTLAYFICTGAGSGAADVTTSGVEVGAQAQLYQINVSSCGGNNYRIDSNTGNTGVGVTYTYAAAKGYRLSADNATHANILVEPGAEFACHSCDNFGSMSGGAGLAAIQNLGGELWLQDSSVVELVATTPVTSYACTTNSGCVLHMQHVVFGKGSSGVPSNGIQCSVSCTVYSSDSTIEGLGAANTGWWDDTASGGSVFYSLGGNTLVGSTTVHAGGTIFLDPRDNLSSATTYSPTCAFTSGGGSTPSCALQAGSTNEKGVIIATTGTGSPASTGTITLTFVGTYSGPAATNPVCRYAIDNSGTAWGNESGTQVSTQSTTAPVLNWFNLVSGTLTALTASSPYRIAYDCTAR